MCMTSAEENPKHKWILTKAGADLHQQWLVEQLKRDADVFDVITYNDYSGYGTGEVVENMVLTPQCYHSIHLADVGSFARLTLPSAVRKKTLG